MTIADSDVLIDYLAGVEPMRSRVALEIESGSLATTVVTEFELFSGVQSEGQAAKLERLFSALVVLPLEESASRRAASIRRKLEAQGKGLAMADYLIAGICLSHSAPLLTRNSAHFGQVPGLSLAAPH